MARAPKPIPEEHKALLATLRPWTPPPMPERPARPLGGSGRMRALPQYVTPMERPGAGVPCLGAAGLTQAEVDAWIAVDPFVRSGMRPATQRALAWIETFKPKRPEPPMERSA